MLEIGVLGNMIIGLAWLNGLVSRLLTALDPVTDLPSWRASWRTRQLRFSDPGERSNGCE